MNWHVRYTQQAAWSRELRDYIFDSVEVEKAQRILEVGCGTGAVLSDLPKHPGIHGLDIQYDSLLESRLHAPGAFLVQGDVLHLPYLSESFGIVYSHFLLLWVKDPLRALREMARVTRKGGYIIAFAEPNYLERLDEPEELIPLGRWQTEALLRQGADPGLGARLAGLFVEAGITILETGTIQSRKHDLSPQEWEIEWEVIESDLRDWVLNKDIQSMKRLDKQAREQGRRILHVPTHFAWGRKSPLD